MKEFIIVGLATGALIVMVRVLIPSVTHEVIIDRPVKVTWVGHNVDFDTNLGEEIDRQLKLLNDR